MSNMWWLITFQYISINFDLDNKTFPLGELYVAIVTLVTEKGQFSSGMKFREYVADCVHRA